jgi:hypothetical protein
MLWLRWIFLTCNILGCVAVLVSPERGRSMISRLILPSPGAEGILDSCGWVYVWQLFGVGLVILLHTSVWHLIWWFLVGWIVAVSIGKLLLRMRFHANPN